MKQVSEENFWFWLQGAKELWPQNYQPYVITDEIKVIVQAHINLVKQGNANRTVTVSSDLTMVEAYLSVKDPTDRTELIFSILANHFIHVIDPKMPNINSGTFPSDIHGNALYKC